MKRATKDEPLDINAPRPPPNLGGLDPPDSPEMHGRDVREETREELGLLPEKEIGSREEAHRILAEHVRVSKPFHYDLMVLWASQIYLRAVLPDECCVNLGFSGPKSSGKTKATKIAVMLAEGQILSGGTFAALVRTFSEPGAVGIDELDTVLRRSPDLEGILRAGNTWNAVYKTNAPAGKRDWRATDMKVGGPRVFNYRSDLEDALKSRTYIVELPRQNDSRLVVSNLFPMNPTGRVVIWLKDLCRRAVKEWTKAKVEAHMKDPAFLARLDALPAAIARNRETAAIFLMIADILGWKLDAEIRQAVEAQAEAETAYEDVREILAAIYRENAHPQEPDLVLLQKDVMCWLNERRGKSERPLTARTWPRVRRELGFEDGKNVKRHGKGMVLVFDADVRRALGIGKDAETTTPNTTAAGIGLDQPAAPVLDHIFDRLRADPGRPDKWIARDAGLKFQLSESSLEDLTDLIAGMRSGLEDG